MLMKQRCLPMTNMCIKLYFGGIKNAYFGGQNDKICKHFFLLQMPPKVIWGSPMTKMYKFAYLWGKKMPILGSKMTNFQTKCVFFQMPSKVIWEFP